MIQNKKVSFFIYILLIVIVLAPRIPALNSFSTLDEPAWLSMGANFYYALGQREFQNTVYEYQPAVTTMWIVTAAMLIYSPEYRGLGQGYLDYEKGVLDPFMLKHGKDPLMLLYTARLIQVLIITFLFLVLFFLLRYFFSEIATVFIVVFASFDPFFLGQSRLLDHEAMLSLFVLISLLAFMIYIFQQKSIWFLILSGVAAGLAQITKSSGIAMLAPIGIVLVIQVFRNGKKQILKNFLCLAGVFVAWLFIMAATYIAFWPGMWVAPGKMLYDVYGNAFSYAFQGARLTVTGNLNTSHFNLNLNFAGIWALVQVLLWRTTPWTWLGVLLGLIAPLLPSRQLARPNWQFITLMLVTATAFIFMFGIAQGRDSPHYILTSYLALNVLAGLGWFCLAERLLSRHSIGFQYTALIFLVALQSWSALSFYPYYYTYRNPILYQAGENREFPQFPYGEGLEAAAQYLAQQPNAKNSTALVYYSRGCFSYFYPGNSIGFRPFYIDGQHAEDLLNAIRSSDYLVVYYANQGKMEKYAEYLDVLSTVKPVHEVWLNGYKYVVIYKVSTLPESVFDALGKLKPPL